MPTEKEGQLILAASTGQYGPEAKEVVSILLNDAMNFLDLRRLCGYVENGSSTLVKLSQDDATREWCVNVDKLTFYGSSLSEAVSKAAEAIPDEL